MAKRARGKSGGRSPEPADASGRPADEAPDTGVDEAPPSWKNAWPFWVALVVVALAVAGIALSYVLRPAEDRAGEQAQVQYAINDVYTAKNRLDYDAYRNGTCAADVNAADFPAADAFVTQNRDSQAANGPIVIPQIQEVSVNGDRATARVDWQFDKKPESKQTITVTVVRENGDWKVCTR